MDIIIFFKKIFINLLSAYKKNNILYRIEEIFRDSSGENIVVVKIIGDSRGMFNMPATKLVSKRKDLLAGFSLEDVLSIVGLATSEKNPQIVEIRHSTYKYYSFLAMIFGSILVISNILSSKLINLDGFTMTGGQIIFPLSYILGDIITEVYGYKRSRQLIWGSILCNLIFVLFSFAVINLPPSPYYKLNTEFGLIIGSVPRVIFASLIGYFCGEFINSFLLSKLKISSKGQHLWRRLFGSSAVAIALASCVFTCFAFVGIMPLKEVLLLALRVYCACILYEILSLPFTVYFVGVLKRLERVDMYDFDVNYTPFSLDVNYTEDNNLFDDKQKVA